MYQLPLLPDPFASWFLPEVEEERLAARYGPMPHLMEDPTSCLTCRGRGSFRFYSEHRLGPTEAGQQIVEYACPCRDQALLQRWLWAKGVDRYLASYYVGDLRGVDTPSRDFFSAYLNKLDAYLDHGRGFLLYGKNGNGKSLMACLVLKRCAELGHSIYWATFNQLLDLYTEGFGSREDRHWFDAQVRSARVLVLDDIGKEHQRRTIAVSALDHVLRTRIQGGLTTLITTNLGLESVGDNFEVVLSGAEPPSNIPDLYGQSTLSLLTQACALHHVTGTDWRQTHFAHLVDYEIEHDVKRPFTFGMVGS